MRILLQFPEGLKKDALSHAKELSSKGHEVFISASSCFGGCDVAIEEALAVKAQKIIHFGHSEFSKLKIPGLKIEYVPCFVKIDWDSCKKLIAKSASLLRKAGAKKVALVCPVQHVKNLAKAKRLLESEGIIAVIEKGKGKVRYAGQVLGCNPSAAYSGSAAIADAVVFFGGGKFHPTGIPPNKPVLACDPHLMDSYWITDEIKKAERKRTASIIAASEAKSFGILLSTKHGQFNLKGALSAKSIIERAGRQAQILVASEFSPLSLNNFLSFDAYINTACPRIIDDWEAFGKPIVNISDLHRLIEIIEAQSKRK